MCDIRIMRVGRKKIEIKRIKDDRNRSVTFLKRKNGLMKKAMELSILCDCQIGLIIFNAQGKLFKYASDGNLDGLIARAEAHNDNFEDKKNQDLQEMILRKEREREAKEREKAMGNSTMIITRTPQSYMNGSTSKAFNANNNNNNNNNSSSSSNNNNNNNNNSNTNGSYSSGTSDDEYIPPHQAVPPQQQPHPLPVHQQRHPHHTQPHHPPPHPHQQHPYGHPRHMQQQPYHSHPHHQQHQQQPYPNMHPNMPQHHPHHQQQHQHQQQNYYTASGLGLTNNLDLYNNLTPRSAAQVDSINKAFQNYSNHSVKQESPANSMVAHAAHQVHPQHAMVHPVQGYGGYNNVPNNMPYHANPAMDEPDPKRRRKDTFSRLRVAIPQEGEAGIAAMGMPPAANGVVATGPQQQGPLLSASSTSSTSTADEQFEQFQQQPQPPQQQQQYTNRPPMPQQPWISTTQGETPVTTAAVTMSTTTTTTTTSKFVYPSPYVSNSAAPMMDHNSVAQGQPFNAPGNPLSTPSSLLSPGALDTPGKIGLMPSPFLPDMSSENNPFPDTPMTMTTPRSFWGNSSKLLGIEGGLVGSSGELGTPSGIVPDVANQLSMLSGQKNPMLERFGNGGNRRSYNSLLSPIMNNHAPAPTSTAITLSSSSSNSCQNNNNTNNNDAIITSTTTTTMPTTATTSPTAAAATTTK